MAAWATYPEAHTHWEAIALLFKEAWERQTVRVGLCNDMIDSLNDWYHQHNNTPVMENTHDTGGGANLTR